MRSYEIGFLVKNEKSQLITVLIELYTKILAKHAGTVHKVEYSGYRKLAYLIYKTNQAHYVLMYVECKEEALFDIKKQIRYNDAIIRNVIYRISKAMISTSTLARRYQKKRRRMRRRRRRKYGV